MTGAELEKIYNEAYKAVYWTAMSLLKNEADAEDIVQDTFVSFIESYSDIEDTSKATALLKRIAANKCLNRIKLARTDAVEDEFFEDVEAVPEDFLPDSLIESEEMRRVLMDIIDKSLSDDIRRTLILFYFDEMSTKEIAEALDVPEGTVRRRLNFARNKIKKEVEKYEKDKNTKMFGMALPFLTKLFLKEAEQVPLRPMPASLMNLSASVQNTAVKAGSKAAKEAAKKGADTMLKKVIIGSAIGVVAVGATIGIVIGVMNHDNGQMHGDTDASEIEESAHEENQASDSNIALVNTYDADESVSEMSEQSVEDNDAKYQLYSLDGMSNDEIYDLMLGFSKDISTGDTLDDYSDRFAVNPKNSTDYYAYTFLYPNKPSDCVKTVQCFVDQETDGTITVDCDSYVLVAVELKDFDKAADLYDLLYDYLLQNTPDQTGVTLDDREEATSWYSCVYCQSGDDYYTFGVSVYDNPGGDDFILTAELPILSE